MRIYISDEDIKKIKEDGYLSICIEKNDFCIGSYSYNYIDKMSMKGMQGKDESK